MEICPCESDGRLAIHFTFNLKMYYYVEKILPVDPVRRQMEADHILKHCSSKFERLYYSPDTCICTFFNVLLTVHLSIISVINQLDAQNIVL